MIRKLPETPLPGWIYINDPKKKNSNGELGGRRLVKDLKFISHAFEENGKTVFKNMAQMVVIGTRQDWKHWIPLELFMRSNPHAVASAS